MDSTKGSNDVVLTPAVHRSDFPAGFLFGTSTSAYQVEGAALKYGRGMCNWDKFTFTNPGKIQDGTNASVSIDHYHRVKEDVKLLKKLGANAYRFSISWSRILPAGSLNGGVNPEGVKFYNDLIDLLVAENIEPFLTLFHFDTPQTLEDEYGGFLNSKIVDDIVDFAKICFFEFGDRVKNWITVNEAWTYSVMGYAMNMFPHSQAFMTNPNKDCYTVGHNILLAHANIVKLYKSEFASFQGGQIGITNQSFWFEPADPNSQEDVAAALRAIDFMFGWFTEPVVTGDYPATMKKYVGNRLPVFTDEEKNILKGSADFIGVNYYAGQYAKFSPNSNETQSAYYRDQHAELTDYKLAEDGKTQVPIGEDFGVTSLSIVPWGFRNLILHTKEKYGDPIIYITENGLGLSDENTTLKESLDDEKTRTRYLKEHLAALKEAMDQKARVKGYFTWSMFDNFEWLGGYKVRYGLYYVDYNNGLKRYPKHSAQWFMKFLKDYDPKSAEEEGEEEEMAYTTTPAKSNPPNSSNKRRREDSHHRR